MKKWPPEMVFRALCATAWPILTSAFRPNCCVAATRLGILVLERFGIAGRPAITRTVVGSRAFADWIISNPAQGSPLPSNAYYVDIDLEDRGDGVPAQAIDAAPPTLLVTSEMLDQARGNKAAAIFNISVNDFLRLTTTRDIPPSSHAKESKPLDFYNDLAEREKIIIMPFLKVEMATGKVIGHEGRHRTGAVLREVGPDAKIKVAIILAKDRYAMNKEDPGPPDFKRRYYGVKDVPLLLHGQFQSTVVAISPRGAQNLADI